MFTARDPLFEKYFWLSPYAYCANNPVKYIDPDGEWPKLGAMLRNFFNKGQGISYTQSTGEWGYQKNLANGTCSYRDGLSQGERNSRVDEYKKTHYINKDGEWSRIYTIEPMDDLTSFEMWLNSPSEGGGEFAEKIAANLAYGIVNSPYSLLTGHTIGGTDLNPTEKMDAFIDFVPGLLTGGFSKTGEVFKTTQKGLQGYNQFVKGAKKSGAEFNGTNWQQSVGKAFQINKTNQQSLKDFNNGLKTLDGASAVKKELDK
jgi:hypothetical protein